MRLHVKLTILFGILYANLSYSQSERKPPLILLFYSEDSKDDSCLCNPAMGYYIYWGADKTITIVERGLCSDVDRVLREDTTQTEEYIKVARKNVRRPHPIASKFKFTKSHRKILINSSDSLGVNESKIYNDFDRQTTDISTGAFYTKVRELKSHFTEVLSMDSTIRFNEESLSCIVLKETFIASTQRGETIMFLTSENLLPVEIRETIFYTLNNPISPATYNRTYSLIGIIKINDSFSSRFETLFEKWDDFN